MEPEHLHFGGGASGTVLHPFVALEMAIAIVLILSLPRKSAVGAFLWMIFVVPLGQVVVLGGVHFTVLRIIVLAGLARRATSKRASSPGGSAFDYNPIDRLVTLWALSALVINSVEWMQTPALIANLGDCLDLLGGYLVLRFLIQDQDDVRHTLKVFAVITVVMGCCMINEQVTHQNIFGLLGGISLYPQIREGKLRSQGAFGVYIDAGVFGANLIPLFIWMWSERRSRGAAAMGMVGAITMVLTCNSSTPLLSFAAGILGLCLWRFRNSMRLLRRGLVIVLVGLHLVMKGPVWSLIARVDLTGSSSGYHRYYLVDNCIRHFSDWWLIGYKDYGSWGWDMWDLSNQFVAVALTGGLLTLMIFVSTLSRSFSLLGTARKYMAMAGDGKEEWFLWCLGATVFAHITGWFGCSYMAQMEQTLSALLAMISVGIFETMRLREAKVEILADSHLASVPPPAGT
jgi:hypothetical protein